ncbi:hypothetical protein K461DRAFT_264901 [Myriangium duriaei CBS 260.36]|uniref:Major facilitator superfamily (MFS) profile domain-containing protein n=1 Tax=Myriangium duriaei CBS 260.36 TaxID=1168546 RepID=A0A9P4MT36_9PEZI|nr:hypothetical protein K461DRAFT_264901 [Myriangium duriaei CBS 260.36]
MVLAQAQWTGTPSIKGSSESMRMMLLTFSLIGLQFTWGVEMTYCTPYLLELGLTKSKLSLVWIAGPLSGLIVQPIVGIMADKSKSKYGRRRPVMIAGSLVVAVLLLVLGWTAEIVGIFVADKELKRELTIVLAVVSIYALDFAINAVQSSCRSLIVDTLPIPKQQLGSAWASRMVAVGHLIGYGIGALDLSLVFGTVIGDTQFKQLIVIAAFVLLFAIGLTSWAVTERILISDGSRPNDSTGIISTLSAIFHTATNLPPQIRAICHIQFWSWISWFPFLFYSSTWVGETYLRYDAPASVRDSPSSLSQIGRVGSTTLILFSIVTFACSLLLPRLISSPVPSSPRITPRPPSILRPLLPYLPARPSLLTAWLASHLLFAFTLLWAPAIHSLHSAAFLVAASGLPWALACWAPFTFIGVEINRLPSSASTGRSRSSSLSLALLPLPPAPGHKSNFSTDLDPANRLPDATVLHLRQESWSSSSASPSSPDPYSSADDDDDSKSGTAGGGQTGELAGVYLGILNLYTTLPQFVATGISTVVFALLEPGKNDAEGEEGRYEGSGVSGIAVCMFIGAFSSAMAGWRTWTFGKTGA